MKSKFMDVVPKPAQFVAAILLVLVSFGGSVVGYFGLWADNHGWGHLPLIGCLALGFVGGVIVGFFFAAWVVCLGYVYGDARRRGMQPVLWLLIAALFPNLFGFLLYFALRQSLMPRCGSCGQPLGPEQRFCSWCGSPRAVVVGAQGVGPAATL